MVSRKQRVTRERMLLAKRKLTRYEAVKPAECDPSRGGCGARSGEPCMTPAGRYVKDPHRLRVNLAIDLGYYVPEDEAGGKAARETGRQ